MILLPRSTFLHRPTSTQTTKFGARLQASEASRLPSSTPSPSYIASPAAAEVPHKVESLQTANALNADADGIDKQEIKQKSRGKRKPRAAPRKTKSKASTACDGAMPAANDAAAASNEQSAALLKLTKGELQAMALECDVAKSGTKAQLVERILVAKAALQLQKESWPAAVVVSQTAVVPTEHNENTANEASEAALITSSQEEAETPSPVKFEAEEPPKKHQTSSQTVSQAAAPVAAALPPLAATSGRPRRLSPEEAAQVLEDLVKQKGTAGVGLSSSLDQGLSLEMKSLKEKVAAFKADLSMQEESAERLRTAMMEKTAATEATTLYDIGRTTALSESEAGAISMNTTDVARVPSVAAQIEKEQGQRLNQVQIDQSTPAVIGDTLQVEEKDIVRDQGALGTALAAGIIVGAEVTIAAASLAGKLVQRWVQGQKTIS